MRREALWTLCLILAANAATALAKDPKGVSRGGADDEDSVLDLEKKEEDYVKRLAGLPSVIPIQQQQEAPTRQNGRQPGRNGIIEVRATAAATPAGLFVHETIPLQTPPPRLRPRQNDDGQISALSSQIQSLSDVASSISQASRLVSQTSQQLAQQVTQLSQSTDRLSQSIQSLQQSAQQAQQSAQQAQDAARQASQSASDAIRSAQSSASSALAASLASITSSAGNALAAVSASAVNAASLARSQVQSAQADATIARANAETQVQQAQGTAVSVTQTALAVVGTFVGSVLLTVLAVYLVLRRKGRRDRRRSRRRTDDLGGGRQQRRDGNSRDEYDESVYSYHPDQKESRVFDAEKDDARASDAAKKDAQPFRSSSMKRDTGGEGFGFAMFGSGDVSLSSGDSRASRGPTGPAAGPSQSLSLFPRTPRASPGSQGLQGATLTTQAAGRPGQAITTQNQAVAVAAAKDEATSNPTKPPPSLQQWLSEGTVSPFGTLKREETQGRDASKAAEDLNWPFERRQQQLRAMMKRSMGADRGG